MIRLEAFNRLIADGARVVECRWFSADGKPADMSTGEHLFVTLKLQRGVAALRIDGADLRAFEAA